MKTPTVDDSKPNRDKLGPTGRPTSRMRSQKRARRRSPQNPATSLTSRIFSTANVRTPQTGACEGLYLEREPDPKLHARALLKIDPRSVYLATLELHPVFLPPIWHTSNGSIVLKNHFDGCRRGLSGNTIPNARTDRRRSA